MVLKTRNKKVNNFDKTLLRVQSPMLIMSDLRSAHNVGSIFRTSDAAGIQKIFLTGTTPTPIDTYERPRKEISKTALGAEKTIPWEYVKSTLSLLKKLKKEGVKIIAIEQSTDSVDYKKVKLKKASKETVAFIIGNEVEGIPSSLLKYANIVAEIPMNGLKESLNVGVAAGVALFRILNI